MKIKIKFPIIGANHSWDARLSEEANLDELVPQTQKVSVTKLVVTISNLLKAWVKCETEILLEFF